MPRLSAPSRRDCSPDSALAARSRRGGVPSLHRCLAAVPAAALFALAVLVLGTVAPAQAAVLVSNIGQTVSALSPKLGTTQDLSQGFTTGTTAGTLDSIEVKFAADNDGSAHPTVTLHRGSPTSTAIATLTAPSGTIAATAANYTYTAPSNTTLTAATTYYVVLEGSDDDLAPQITTSDNEDSGGETGWSVANGYGFRTASSVGAFATSSSGAALLIRVNGTAATTCPVPDLVTGRTAVWTATMTVGESALLGIPANAYSKLGYFTHDGTTYGSLSDTSFTVNSRDYTINGVQLREPAADGNRKLSLQLNKLLADLDRADLQFHVCGTSYTLTGAAHQAQPPAYIWDPAVLDWTAGEIITLRLSATTVPSKPLNLAADGGDTQVTLTWTAPARDGATAITHYQYRHAAASTVPMGTAWTDVADGSDMGDSAADERSVAVSGLMAETQYAFELRAVNSGGESTVAGPVTATLGLRSCSSEPDLAGMGRTAVWTATMTVGEYAVASTYSHLGSFTYEGTTYGSLSDTSFTVGSRSYTVDAVRLQEPHSDENRKLSIQFNKLLADLDRADLQFHVCGASYALTGAARQSQPPAYIWDPVELDWTAGRSVILRLSVPTAPSKPRNLAADGGDTQVTLTWTAPARAGVTAITHYQYRHAVGTTVSTSTTWTDVPDGSDAGVSTADELGVTVSSLINGTEYAFEVRAVNSAGEGAKAGPVTATPAVACAMPDFGNRRNIWSGSLTAAAFNPIVYGFGGAVGSLDDKDFTIGQAHEIDAVGLLTHTYELRISLKDGPLTSSEKAALRLHVCDAAYDFSAAGGPSASHTYSWLNTGLDWPLLSTQTLHLSLPANTAATGKPAISGSASTGQTLTAVKGTIADVDGVPVDANGVPTTFTYQWVRVDGATETDISAATSRTYTPGADDIGKKIKVKVSFTDALGSEETGGTSDAYPRSGTITATTVPGAPQNLMASAGDGEVVLTWSAPASDGGGITEYDYRYVAGTTVPPDTSWTTVADGSDAGMSTADERGVTIGSLTNATAYAFEVRAVNSAGVGTPAGPVTATPAAGACAGPNFGTRRNIWTGSLTVEPIMIGAITIGYGFTETIGDLDDKTFTVGANSYEIAGVTVFLTGDTAGLNFGLKDANLTSAEKAALRLHVCNTAYDFSTASGPTAEHYYHWAGSLDWSGSSERTLYLSLPANTAATGTPAISGTATVGETLMAAKGTIADADGVPAESTFTYQWVRVDGSNETDISIATSSSYTLGADDSGKKIKVKVSFTDTLGSAETRTSDAYPSSGTVATVPGEPTSFMATAGNAMVDLGWAAPASDGGAAITHYQYRHAAGSTVPPDTLWTDVADGSDDGNSTADETGVTVSSLINGTEYAFEVRAVNSAGEGAQAGPARATPTANAAPVFANDAATRSITETVGDAVAVAGDVGAAVTATDAENDTLTYTLEGADAAKFDIDSASGQIETRAGEQYDREAKASYSVTVKASDPSGGSDTIAVTIAVDNVVEKPVTPEAPTVTVTSGSATSLDVSWAAPGNVGRPALSGYKLRYRPAGVGAWTDHSHTGVGTSATIASLPETTTYEVQVRAVNADGDGDWSASGSATTGTVVVPGAPRNLMVSAGDAQAVLTWTAPASDGGAPIVKYRYRYAAGSAVPSGVSWRDVPDSADAGTSAGDETGVTVTGLVNDRQYAFEVQAVNSAGGGAAAGPETATPAENPDAPSQVVDLRAVVSNNTVELTWAAPERSGRGRIARYEYRHAAGSTVLSGTAWRSAEARRFPSAYVAGLQNGRRHVFEVRAVNAGAIEGPGVRLAATPRAQAAQTLPMAPRGLRGNGSLYVVMAGQFSSSVTERAQVKFSWEAPSNLGNSHLVRYEYRYAARGESLSSAAWNHGPASERTLTVRNLVAGTSYTFQLRAVTLAGAGRAASVGVTTPRSKRLSLSVFTRGSAVEGENLTIGVRRSGTPNKAVLVVVDIHDSTASLPTAKAVDIAAGGREGTVEFAVPFDGQRGAARELEVTLSPGSWKPESTYRVGTPSRATVRVRNMDPLVSVRDARVREGAGALLRFAVTLDRAAARTVTVDYATSDATATAGSDYTAKSGMLTIAAGARRAAIEVAVLDDAIDEGTETMTLTLSNARGAALDDASATGSITNRDPLQKMWLSRFGRTVSGHVMDAVSGRLSGPLAGAQVTVGGQRVELSGGDDEAVVAQVLTGIARVLGAGGAAEPEDDEGPGVWSHPGGDATAARRMTGRELVLGSAFHVASGGERAGGPGFAAWGRVTTGGFDGEGDAESGAVRIDGEVSTGILGADAAWDGWLAGVAVSLSEGEGEYADSGLGKARVESTLTNVSPYARVDVNERVSTWGLLGYGTGEMTITEAATEGRPREQVTKTGIAMRLGALGVRGAVVRPDEAGGLDVALRADAFVARTEWDAVSNERDRQADASRVRFILEGRRAFVLGGGAVLTPSLELGLRHDGGDAETGTGVEVGGGVRYAASGLSVEARARTLIAHEDSGYEEWGASASVRLDPGASGRGLSFTLSPAVGAESSGVARLWSLADARALEPGGEGFEASRRLEAELGYGVGAFGGLSTPYAGLSLGDGGGRTWRSGVRWSFGQAFNLELEGSRSETGDEADHAMRLRCAMRW